MKNLVRNIKLLTDGNKAVKKIFESAISRCLNSILAPLAQIIRESTLEEIPRGKRVEIAGKITSAINTFILPIVDAIEEDNNKKSSFNGSEFARDINAISSDMELIVKTVEIDENTNGIEVAVGKKIEVPEDMDEDLIKMAMASNQLGKA